MITHCFLVPVGQKSYKSYICRHKPRRTRVLLSTFVALSDDVGVRSYHEMNRGCGKDRCRVNVA